MLDSLTHAVSITQIGWLLVHSLWQLALLAVLALTLQRALQRRSASTRYLVLLTALALMVAAPIGTWVSQSPGEGRSVAARFIANISLSSSALIKTGVAEGQTQLSGQRTASPEPGAQSLEFIRNSVASLWIPVQQRIKPWLPQIVFLWFGGVLAAAFRPLLSWSKVQQLRTRGVSPVPDAVHGLAARVAERLQLARAVAVRQSTLASSPVVVGYFRPVVLLPPCVVTDLPPTQVELILAHELWHARRHDYLVNLLQTVVETLFFYHPAVWWLSRQVRIERENCCDDAAMEMAANRAEYGRALLAIEEHLRAPTALSIAAHGGSLLARIRRIAGCESSSRFAPWGGTFSFITILTFAAVAWAAIAAQPLPADSALFAIVPRVDGLIDPRSNLLAVADGQEPFGFRHMRDKAGRVTVDFPVTEPRDTLEHLRQLTVRNIMPGSRMNITGAVNFPSPNQWEPIIVEILTVTADGSTVTADTGVGALLNTGGTWQYQAVLRAPKTPGRYSAYIRCGSAFVGHAELIVQRPL